MPTPALSSGVAEPCPACGAPAALMREEDSETIVARCSGRQCDPEWKPLDEWNSGKLQVVPATENRSLDRMKRADVPAIVASFLDQAGPLIERAQALVVTDASQVELIDEARDLRLAIRDMRLAVKGKHKEVKAGLLEQTREVDKLLRVVDRFDAAEAHLKEQEQFVARQEAEARMRLQQEREEMLRPFIDDEGEFLEATADLAKMPAPAFYHLRDGYEAAHVARLKREREAQQEAEATAQKQRDEQERVRAENERVRAENERLRKEAAEKERALEAERAVAEQQRRAAAAKAREDQQAIEDKARKERAEAASKHEKQLAAERKAASEAAAKERERQRKELADAEAEREKVAAAARKEQARLKAIAYAAELEAKTIREARESAEAEERRQQEEAAAEREAAAKAPDREKLLAFADRIATDILPKMATKPGLRVNAELTQRLAELADWLRSQAESL